MRTTVKVLILSAFAVMLLTGLAIQEDWGSSPAAKKTFVGSDTCKVCHPGKYKSLGATAHTKMTQKATKKTVVMPVKNKVLTTPDGKVMFKLKFKGSKKLFLTLYNLDGTGATTFRVHRVLGGAGKAGKQRLMIEFNKDGENTSTGDVTHLLSPVQFNHKDKNLGGPDGEDTAFSAYKPEHWYTDTTGDDKLDTLITNVADLPGSANPSADAAGMVTAGQFKNSWERRCIGCHATGQKVKYDKKTGFFANQSSEYNVWCESCHGPGSAHATSANKKDIINPDDIKDFQTTIDICARCHSHGTNYVKGAAAAAAAFGTGYPSKVTGTTIKFMKAGDKLSQWYSPDEGTWGSNDSKWGKYATKVDFSKHHEQQGFDFKQTEHFSDEVRCWDCHTPHSKGVESPQMRLSNDTNALCLSCHKDMGFATQDDITAHTQHSYSPDGTGTSRCSKCHFPKTIRSQGSWGPTGGDIHSHSLEIIKPGLTNLMAKKEAGKKGKATAVADGIALSNGCYGCHSTDKDYGVARWKRFLKKGGGQKP